MKSDIAENRQIFECSCMDTEHHMVIDPYDEIGVAIYIANPWKPSFIRRVKDAFKYVFQRYPLTMSGEILLDKKQIDLMIKALKKMS